MAKSISSSHWRPAIPKLKARLKANVARPVAFGNTPRRPTTARTRKLCGSLPITFFGERNFFFLINTVRLHPTSFIGQTAHGSSGDVVIFRDCSKIT
jgi:hypothetical protein